MGRHGRPVTSPEPSTQLGQLTKRTLQLLRIGLRRAQTTIEGLEKVAAVTRQDWIGELCAHELPARWLSLQRQTDHPLRAKHQALEVTCTLRRKLLLELLDDLGTVQSGIADQLAVALGGVLLPPRSEVGRVAKGMQPKRQATQRILDDRPQLGIGQERRQVRGHLRVLGGARET